MSRPTELLGAPATRRVATSVFTAEQLDRFAARTGVDPRELTEIVVAVHPEGRVILARGPLDAPFVVQEAGERMAPLEASVDEPFVRRAGFLPVGRVDVAAIASDTIAWIDGTPQLAAEVLASVRRDPGARRHPFTDEAVSQLREASADAPFALIAPHPLGLPVDSGIGLLLARERAFSVAARDGRDGVLEVVAQLRGEFPPGAEQNFRALATSIAQSDLGAAVGARDALPTLRVVHEEDRVELSARVDADVLASGLRAVLVAELPELLEAAPSPPMPPEADAPEAAAPATEDRGAADPEGSPAP